MASKKNKARSARDANPRKFKKKTSVLVIEKVEYIDYKDVDLLSRFMSDRAKIKNRRVAGNDLQQQREVANAVKVAREMALLPYAKRVASTRTGGRRGERGEGRGDRDTSNNENGAEGNESDDESLALDAQVEGAEGAVDEAGSNDESSED
ncbi:30S ribosomal protein S18 [Ilumatobacter coccineus YM16-304]|uniref:Small ribosomal subunit protein bS18 n=1 Tax=Ilumatobacter coccineus (strain NBRC 103263 / KCTC 29153 / YM16-304) TaxID=1313172 RepID=A0A6C7EKW2_ILUCY|nr:30S ribosomal protein S18 [Ilumatobacter coccineus]BAN04576.1 30S ribosomal protein S18 [Ilumatobacter coccineus YM16-304]